MDFLEYCLQLLSSGGTAYVLSRTIRDSRSRPKLLRSFHLSEASSVPYLELLSQRAKNEGDIWLSQQLAFHAQDERKHSQIFRHLYLKDGGNLDQLEEQQKNPPKSKNSLFVSYFEGFHPDELKPENIDWITYAASTHILELDSHKDYLLMAKVLPESDPKLRKFKLSLKSVAQDELKHANYLKEILSRKLGVIEANLVLERWRKRKTKAILSSVSQVF